MTNPADQRPLQVTIAETYGSFIELPRDLVDRVHNLLKENDIPHEVGQQAISVDGGPAMVLIYLSRKTNPRRVQELLDATA
jgi:hypothetical protein